jgi:polyphosphate glucokinase
VSIVLAIDVGGSHVKAITSNGTERRRFASGPDLTAGQMVAGVLEIAAGWEWDVVSIGVPAPVRRGKILTDPVNLGEGWVGFDFEAAFGMPVKIVNDAAMQAIGSYEGGRMLFLGLGTGLGTTLIADGVVVPMELGHLPFRKTTFEEYVGEAAMEKKGKKAWRKTVFDVVERMSAAFLPEEIVIGGGGVKELDELPPECRRGGNDNAFGGGFRLWDPEWADRLG